MAYIPSSNSVVAFQSDPTKLVGTMSVIGTMSVLGTVPVTQATTPWVVNMPSSSVVIMQQAGSVLAVTGSFSSGNTSVTAFQGGAWSTSIVGVASVALVGGNASVSGTVGASLIGLMYHGTTQDNFSGGNTKLLVENIPLLFNRDTGNFDRWTGNSSTGGLVSQPGGSVLAVNVPTPSYISYQLAGSIMAVAATVNTGNSSVQLLGSTAVIGSVAVLQGTNPWQVNVPTSSYISYQLAGSVMAVSGSFSGGNSSVTLFGGGTVYLEKNAVTASALGIPILFKIDETNSVLSAVSPQSPLPVKGSVAVLQGTNPWIINMPSGSVIATQIANSVMGVRTDNASVIAVLSNSSVAVLQGTNPWIVAQNNGSITGTYQEKNATVASAIGIPFLWKNNYTTSTLSTVSINDPLPVQGSVMVLQGTNPFIVQAIGSVAVAINSTNTSIFTVGAGTQITSVMNTLPSSMMVGASVFGTVPVTQVTTPWVTNVPTPSYLSIQPGGSVLNANISGSVAAAITNFTASVAANINVISASIVTNQGTNPWVIGSIVGTYAEDSGHTTTDKGLFTLAVRNDTMSSITSADADYSPFAVGPVGELITGNSPITKWVSGFTSVMSGTSVQVIAAPGTSIFTYITGIYVTNEASIASRVTITQGLGRVASSIVTNLIAPAGGGSNNTYINPLRVLDNLGISASISAVASIYVTITGFTAKT